MQQYNKMPLKTLFSELVPLVVTMEMWVTMLVVGG